ncbi:MAG: hypothetical protein JXR88_14505 [Clostridia bacterium]|nr:hypothetical protein [Clostridia bacterium]
MIKKSIYIGLVISLLLVLLTGCNSEDKELLGKWERIDTDDKTMDFVNSNTLIDGSYERTYKLEGNKLKIDVLGVDVVFEYRFENELLLINRVGEDKVERYIRTDYIGMNQDEVKKLAGSWGQEEVQLSFNEDGTMSVKGIFSDDLVTSGPFKADKGYIRFEPEPYEVNDFTTMEEKYLFIKYEFVEDHLKVFFFDDFRMENFSGKPDVEFLELSRIENEINNESDEIDQATDNSSDYAESTTNEETKEPVIKKEIEVDKIHIESVELEDTLVYVTLNNGSSEDVIISDTGIVLILADNNRVRPYVGSLVITETVPKGTTKKVSNYYSEINEKNIVAIEVFDNDNVLLDRIDFDNSLSEYLYGDTSQPSNENSVLVGKYVAFNDQGLADEYVPSIEFYDDNTFKFTVNIYAGMAESFGRYEIVGAEVQCIINKVGFSGSVGDDVESFYMTLYNDGQTLQYMGEPIGITEKFHFFNRD